MKLSRIWAPLGLAAAALLSFSSSAFAQEAPSYNYVGIGGGDDGFVINGKLSVADNVSIRPEVATDFDFDDSEDVSYLVPVTYDFNSVEFGNQALNPFFGAGVSGDIGDDSDIEFALVAGSAYRFADKYVANASVNYAPFADNDELGFTDGLGNLF